MNRRNFIKKTGQAGTLAITSKTLLRSDDENVSVGMIGLDTSHCTAFTKVIHSKDESGAGTGFQVTHAYPQGSKDIKSSVERIPGYTKEMQNMGVSISENINAMLDLVDAVLLETNDGRLHLEQAQQVIEAGKILFIDKPMAASYDDVKRIFELAEEHQVPVFSSSSLRFSPSMTEIKSGSIGNILGASTYSPAKLEATHPDLFWYGIHGVESLFTLMGPGCTSVQRTHTADTDVVVGTWKDGRIGTFTGLRGGKTGYGGTAFGTEGIASAGIYEGYEHLVHEILTFFKTGVPPVAKEETLEIFAFMEAADRSKAEGGRVVNIEL